jgi:hypothetical protein
LDRASSSHENSVRLELKICEERDSSEIIFIENGINTVFHDGKRSNLINITTSM